MAYASLQRGPRICRKVDAGGAKQRGQALQPAPVAGQRHFALTSGAAPAPVAGAISAAPKGAGLQPALDVSSPGDALELEAESVAERVMRVSDAQLAGAPSRARDGDGGGASAPAASGSGARLQRACAACQQRELPLQRACSACGRGASEEPDEQASVQRSPAADSGMSSQVGPGATRAAIGQAGPGEPLSKPLRSFMEPRFGSSFEHVKLHRGADADRLATSLGARAFTLGSDVYFRRGEFDSETQSGRRLIAHELTHVVQQRGARARVQRAVTDYQIRGIEPESAAFPNMIFFDAGSSAIAASETAKFSAFATAHAGVAVQLKGLSSEEGTAAGNTALANARIAAVDAALNAAGHSLRDPSVVDTASGLGNLDYRRLRAVEMIPAGTTSAVPPSPAVVPCTTQPNYPGHLTSAITEADRLIQHAVTDLTGVRSAATDSALLSFFSSSSDATADDVRDRLNRAGDGLSAHVLDMSAAANHQCMNHCANAAGWNSGCPGGRLTLCPGFWSDPLGDRAELLLHEGAHGAGSICSTDHAYSPARLFAHLTPALQRVNSDTYVLFLRQLDGTFQTTGPTPADTTPGLSGGEPDVAHKIVAWLEHYLTDTYLQLQTMYNRLVAHHGASTPWAPGFYRDMMATLESHFTALTAPPAVLSSTRGDLVRVAAIHDRYRTMRNIFRKHSAGVHVPLNLARGAPSVGTSWQSGPGVNVTLGDDFFALNATPMAQVLFLFGKLVAATPDISPAFAPHYVDFLEAFRVQLGSPEPPP